MARPRTVPTEDVVWNGRLYVRYPGRAYFQAGDSGKSLLHRDVYTAAHGPIPPGWAVHHRDHDHDNNDPTNLVAMSPSDHARHHAAHAEPVPRECDECGMEFPAFRPWARWCSAVCKERRRRREGTAYVKPSTAKPPQTLVCDECGATFQTTKPWGRFCSPLCRGAAGRRRRAG